MSSHADDLETAIARLGEVGLDALDVAATISAQGKDASVRELPRISIDLHSTIGARPRNAAAPKVERDLEVLSALGEGGMGRVLLARQHSLDREVAIKTLHLGASDRDRDALIAEGAITGHLEHPSIVPVHALGLDGDGRPVLVMKRVEGVEWTQLVDTERDRIARHLEILVQVCNAVEFAHSRGIVHRDIKPQNVLIGRYGDVYLCDWGLAVRTDRPWDPQPLCGTPGYMAPEMVLGQPVDARTDVYLLGATLHYVLTRTARNPGHDARVAALSAVESEPVVYGPDVPEELGAIVNRATAKEPADRYPTVAELRAAIQDHLQHGSSLALARTAAARVDEMRGLAGATDETTLHRFDTLGVEAHFAIEQALAQWRDNPVARDAARALDGLLSARRSRAAELERFARDLDPDALGQYRTVAFAALALVGVSLAAVGVARYPAMPSPAQMLYQSFVPFGAVIVMTLVWRARAFATAFNRRLTMLGWSATGGVTLSRALAAHAGTTTPLLLLHDSVLVAVILAIAATHLFRWMAWPALCLFVAAIVCAVSPAESHLAFSIASGVALAITAVVGRRRARS